MIDINSLRQKANTLEPLLRIGKFGLTENVHIEVEKLFKKRELIKIKILNNCPVQDKEDMIEKIVRKSDSILISKVGNIISLYRKKR